MSNIFHQSTNIARKIKSFLVDRTESSDINTNVYPISLPIGAESYLQPSNNRLQDLKHKYAQMDAAVVKSAIWTDDYIKSEELLYFRGDNGYIWQVLDGNLEINYILTTYYLKTIDRLNLFDKLQEDNLFGIVNFSIDGKIVSRDLLDSIAEINFLERELTISNFPNLKILDIGAGYGRLAHRSIAALLNIDNYFCTDAVPISTFIAEYYIKFRGIQDKVTVVPLNEIENVILNKQIDIAVNIHSFSECTIAAISWWINTIAKANIRYIFIAPNVIRDGGRELLTNDGRDFLPIIEAAGYKLRAKSPKYADNSIQKYGLSPTYYYLFENRSTG